MGSRPSRARSSKVQAVEGVQQVVPPPAQKQTASAPPTPQHPEGTPRTSSPSGEFPEPQGGSMKRSATMTDAWMPGSSSASTSLRDTPAVAGQVPDLPGALQSEGYATSPKKEGYPSKDGKTATQAPPPPPGPAPAAAQPVVDTEPRLSTGSSRPVSGGVSHLDLPLEEVLKLATEAFGSSIATALSS